MEMPRVTSAEEARQEEQVLEGLGAMGVAHMQHRMVAVVPRPVEWWERGWGWMVGVSTSTMLSISMIAFVCCNLLGV